MSTQLNTEEREIVETFERGELRRVAEVEAEMEAARQAARNTVKQTRRVTERASASPTRERERKVSSSRGCCRARSTSTCPAH